MSINSEDLIKYANNPNRVINKIISNLEEAYEDKGCELNSTEHPFTYMLDVSVGCSYALLNKMEDTLYKLYPLHSRNLTDLSRHMSDKDWYGMFATPGTTDLTFVMDVCDLNELALDYTSTENNTVVLYKRLIIPKDTVVVINEIEFCLMNGVEIRLYEYGNISVIYDTSTNNPLTPIQSNILDYEKINIKGEEKLKIVIPGLQVSVLSKWNLPSTKLAGFKQTITYTDELYAIRAILYRTNDIIEMNVTYTDSVFDELFPTLVVNYDSIKKELQCVIPDVYLNNGSGIGNINLFIYTTKGNLEVSLKTEGTQNNKVVYKDFRYGKKELGYYSKNINKINNGVWLVTGNGYVVGGKNARSFDDMRFEVIYGNRQGNIPITNDQVTKELQDNGWDVMLSEDYVTGRLFKVSSELPLQTNKGFNSGIGTHTTSLYYSINDLVATGRCYDNNYRVTLKPNSLILINEEQPVLIDESEYKTIMSSSNDTKILLNENNTIVFNPYYYVLDTTDNTVEIRGYHLESPTIGFPTFIYENPNYGTTVGISNIFCNTLEDGFEIFITTLSNDEYKNTEDDLLEVQLSFNTPDSDELANIKGELYGKNKEGERVYKFYLKSNFDIDTNNVLYLNNLNQFGEPQLSTGVDLTSVISFLFIRLGDSRKTTSDSDLKIDVSLFGDSNTCILETKYTITFGKYLNRLYTRVRTVVGEAQYDRYEDNVYALYQSNIYERDDNGRLVFDENNKLKLLHKEGTIMYDDKEEPIIHYHKNQLKMNDKGEYILKEPRKLIYYFDILTFDASYLFSNDEYDISFLKETKSYLHDYITANLDNYNNKALERTSIVFQPKDNLGKGKVIVNSDYTLEMSKTLSFTIVFYVNRTIMDDNDFKELVESKTPIIINDILKTGIVSNDVLNSKIREISEDNILSVKVTTLLDSNEIDIVSNKETNSSFSIKKNLINSGDGLLSIKEDVDFNWRIHKD